MSQIKIERLPEGIRITPAPRSTRFQTWLRNWRNDKRDSVVSKAMSTYAIDGALASLDTENPFTAE
jgi:hypothetical protein